jgi:hypothetical protein
MLTRGRKSRGGGRARGLPPRETPGCQGWCCRGLVPGGSLEGHGELLEEKLIPHYIKGGKRHNPLDESLQVVVAGAEATQKVQHQGTAHHWLAEIAEVVRQAFHLAAVLLHGEAPWENWWN